MLVDLVRPYDESGLGVVESSSMRPRLAPRLNVERLELAGREFDAYDGGGEKKLKYPLGRPVGVTSPLPFPFEVPLRWPLPLPLPFLLLLLLRAGDGGEMRGGGLSFVKVDVVFDVYVVEPDRYLGSREDEGSPSSPVDVTIECIFEKSRVSAILLGSQMSCRSLRSGVKVKCDSAV